MITFLNEPKLSEHEADASFNKRRNTLFLQLKDFINQHSLFADKSISVTFLHTGRASLVSILDDSDKKFILKVPLSLLTSGLEGTFLKAWERVGVKVPHVFEEGTIGEHFYTLMEYIDSSTVADTFEGGSLQNNIYRELGGMLRKMHEVKTIGYSNMVNDKHEPEYSTIAAWLAGDTRTAEQFSYVKENYILNDKEHGSIEDICALIVSRIGESNETVYCHNDFHTGNIFATDPFTVFDPWPCFHHPYTDIARSIILASKFGLHEVQKQLLEGYFGDEPYDDQLLHAFVALNIWIKLPYLHKRNKTETIEDLKNYLTLENAQKGRY